MAAVFTSCWLKMAVGSCCQPVVLNLSVDQFTDFCASLQEAQVYKATSEWWAGESDGVSPSHHKVLVLSTSLTRVKYVTRLTSVEHVQADHPQSNWTRDGRACCQSLLQPAEAFIYSRGDAKTIDNLNLEWFQELSAIENGDLSVHFIAIAWNAKISEHRISKGELLPFYFLIQHFVEVKKKNVCR